MRPIATAQQMRELDRAAIQEGGVASIALMERAAETLAEEAMALAEEGVPPRQGREKASFLPRAQGEVLILTEDGVQSAAYTSAPPAPGEPLRAAVFSGPGNNGGDGVACARLLLEAGYQARCFLVGARDKLTPDTRAMEAKLARVGGKLELYDPGDPAQAAWAMGAHVLVDAVFGIGLNAPIQADALAAVCLMNRSAAPVASADIPSGVEADTGRVLGAAVQAAVTVTFTRAKAGHFVGQGGLHTGRLVVAPIGVPEELLERLETPVQAVYGGDCVLPRRARDAHKGDFGKIYLLGGSVGYTGAPVLAARAAVRTGAGLVCVGVPAPAWGVAASKLDEAMAHPLPAGKEGQLSLEAAQAVLDKSADCGVCLIGPGLGRGNGPGAVVRQLLRELRCPVVLDADGINALEGHIDVLDARRGLFTVLTPHDGEFARLSGALSGGDRLGAAREFAVEHGCCLVLKGHCTITAFPDGTAFLNTTGNPGMAKGGSGDVLAGMIVSLLGQGLPARKAVPAAVWLHGAAGDRCAGRRGEYGMTPSDMVELLPELLKEITG